MFAIIVEKEWQSRAYFTLPEALAEYARSTIAPADLKQTLDCRKRARVVSFRAEGSFPDVELIIVKTYMDTEGLS